MKMKPLLTITLFQHVGICRSHVIQLVLTLIRSCIVSKIIVHSDLLKIPADNLLPIWLKGLPIHMDVEEMTPTYSLLLDLIAREHPFIEPENEEVRDTVLNAFAATLDNPLLPQELRDPLDIAFKRYLSRTSLETQHAWHARLPA